MIPLMLEHAVDYHEAIPLYRSLIRHALFLLRGVFLAMSGVRGHLQGLGRYRELAYFQFRLTKCEGLTNSDVADKSAKLLTNCKLLGGSSMGG